jgi:predicted tellurium resistance membrane protein TerC
MEWIASPEAWVALATLTLLEIVLGVDNIIFISILVGRLPKAQRERARFLGLAFAMATRIALLLLIVWIMRLQADLFTIVDVGFSGRDLILIGGGLFLLAKATLEIHNSLEGDVHEEHKAGAGAFWAVIVQIGIIDIVFSLDSVITAVGMADHVSVMIIAVVIAVGVMMLSASAIGQFVDDHPTIKMLALTFLVLIGVALIGEGLDLHIPKGYIYFAMAFSVVVELLNLRLRRRVQPIHLRKQPPGE